MEAKAIKPPPSGVVTVNLPCECGNTMTRTLVLPPFTHTSIRCEVCGRSYTVDAIPDESDA
jgi:hypothetical protein